MHIIPQPPYSPDLAACDLWLFSKLKGPLRGMRFKSIDEIKAESKKALMAIAERNIWHVWRIGKYVGISVFHQEGITLKGVKLIYKNK